MIRRMDVIKCREALKMRVNDQVVRQVSDLPREHPFIFFAGQGQRNFIKHYRRFSRQDIFREGQTRRKRENFNSRNCTMILEDSMQDPR